MPVPDRLSLQELTEAAGVPVRTVRYYIAEGLLPPPMGSGPASFYTPNHLLRLRLIGRMKDAYLPLKEIRRRLEGTPDEAVEGLLEADDAALFDPATWRRAAPPDDAGSTLRYIDRALARQATRTLRESAPIPFRAVEAPAPEAAAEAREDLEAAAADGADGWPGVPAGDRRPPTPLPVGGRSVRPAVLGRAPGKGTGIGPAPVVPAVAPRGGRGASAAVAEPERWRRISLGPGADLLVSEDLYERLRSRVDWLVRQARRVFE
jgi:DNA-binding transcriptional MerR regulator